MEQEIKIFHWLDQEIAKELEVETQVYIDKIESISEWKRSIILKAIWSEESNIIEKVKRIFSNIPNPN